MSTDWEKALLSKTEELLYNDIIDESDHSHQQSQLYFIILYFTMRMKDQNRGINSLTKKSLQKLLHEMKEFQSLQEKRLSDFELVDNKDSDS